MSAKPVSAVMREQVLAAQLNGAMDVAADILAYIDVVLKPEGRDIERLRSRFFAASEQVQRVLGEDEYGPNAPGWPDAAALLDESDPWPCTGSKGCPCPGLHGYDGTLARPEGGAS